MAYACFVPFGVRLLGLQAQAQFSIEPTDSLVTSFVTDSVPRIFQIDFPNQTQDSLGITWRRVGGGWTEGWDVSLCDLGECYSGVPSDADMMPMPQGEPDSSNSLSMPSTSKANASLHFWVWPSGNQDALVNVYFDLATAPSVPWLNGRRSPCRVPGPIHSVRWPPCRWTGPGSTLIFLLPPCNAWGRMGVVHLHSIGDAEGLGPVHGRMAIGPPLDIRSDSQTPMRVIVH